MQALGAAAQQQRRPPPLLSARCSSSSWPLAALQKQVLRWRPLQRPSCRRRLLLRPAAAKDGDKPSREDRSNPNKADFSAYWSLKFREFFSKRRQYLELSRQRQEPPEILKKLDEQIAAQEAKLEEARMQRRRMRVEKIQADPKLQQQAAEQDQQVLADAMAARAALAGPRLKLLHLTVYRLRAALRALVLLPLSLPAAAAARWQALFASQAYEHFLLSEGERVWAFRNRTENERWFWEVFAMDRLLVPVAWAVCYQAVTPANLIWSVLVPVAFIAWQNGRLPGPANLEWWLIMVFGLYAKCWDQVVSLAAALLAWW